MVLGKRCLVAFKKRVCRQFLRILCLELRKSLEVEIREMEKSSASNGSGTQTNSTSGSKSPISSPISKLVDPLPFLKTSRVRLAKFLLILATFLGVAVHYLFSIPNSGDVLKQIENIIKLMAESECEKIKVAGFN